MIISGNSSINKVYYNGYTISKIYACGGSLVWSGDTPTPPTGDTKLHIHWYDSGNVGEYDIPCDSTYTITNAEVRIQPYSFSYRNIDEVEIGDCVTSIGNSAFYDCINMKMVNSSTDGEFNIPNNITSIGNTAFFKCESLVNLSLPSGLTSISDNCFGECTNLQNTTIPSGVTSIGRSAFQSCSSLTSIEIPSGVTTINNAAFSGCTSLSSVIVNAINPPALGTNVFSANANNRYIYVPCESLDLYKTASHWSDYRNRFLPIQNSCHSYSEYVIYEQFDEPNSISLLCGQRPSGDIVNGSDMPNKDTSSHQHYIKKLKYMYFGECCTQIGDSYALSWDGATNLNAIFCYALTPPVIYNGSSSTYLTFDNTNDCPIYVPTSAINAYKSTAGWSKYSTRIKPM